MAPGFGKQPWRLRHLGKNLEEKSSFQATAFLRALNCVEPSLSWLQNRKTRSGIGLMCKVIYVHAHKYTNLAFAHDLDLGFSHSCVSQNARLSDFPKGSDMPM